jgi:hypothetical protein
MFCIVCLLIAIALPIATYLFMNIKFSNMEYSDYSYWYEDVFFQKLPTQSVPSNHHSIYILANNIRFILLAICFAFLGQFPIAALLTIILIHVLYLFYTKFFNV